jgi:predicted phage terminase large subunit-like protein
MPPLTVDVERLARRVVWVKETVARSPYIPHDPFPRQAAFMALDCEEAGFGGSAGGGKMAPVSSMVCTPFGFRPMGDLAVGDQVSNPDGSVARVLRVWDHGERDVWRVTLADGSSTRCGSEHLWLIHLMGKRYKADRRYLGIPTVVPGRIADTTELRRMVEVAQRAEAAGRRAAWPSLPMTEPVQFTRNENRWGNRWPVDPYILGAILGDGHIADSHIMLTTADADVADAFVWWATMLGGRISVSRKLNNLASQYAARVPRMSETIRNLGLDKARSHNKFVPDVYKVAPLEVRYALMQGLMDTDGYVDDRGHCSYTTISERLALDVQWLARSLGFRATMTSKIPTYQEGSGRRAYTVYMTGRAANEIIRMTRKAERLTQPQHTGWHRVVSVEPDCREACRCITVDHPNGLYIADDFVVTHNSDALLMDALLYADRPDYSGLLLRRTFAELALPGALMDRATEWLLGKGCKWDSETHTWRFPSGATLTFGHMETTGARSRYQSTEFSYIGVDEAVLMREADYLFLFSRLRRRAGSTIPGRMRSATNPPTLEAPGSDWYERRFSPDAPRSERPFVKSRLWDNPHIDQPDYESKLNRLDVVTRARLLYGNWKIRAAGKMFNRAWFRVTETVPRIGFRRQVRWWDMAATERPDEAMVLMTGKKPRDPDWTVGLLLAQDHEDHCYVVDVVRGQWAPGAVEDVIVSTAILDGRDVSIRWGEEPGSAGKIVSAALRRRLRGYDAQGIKETGNKEVRARAVSAAAFHRELSIVPGPWTDAFWGDLETFPGGAHDDHVDALSGAYSQLGFRADVGDLDEVNRELGRPTDLLSRRPV